MTALRLCDPGFDALRRRRLFPWRHAAAAWVGAVLALPLAAQNWVGFGDNAWPAGNTLSSRGTILPAGAGELMVRLDGWEHGGWGHDSTFPGTRTIDAVKFYAHSTFPLQSSVVRFYNEGAPHTPFLGAVLGIAPIAFSPVPVLHILTFPPVRIPCTGLCDMFISFAVAPGDGIKIGQVDTTTDIPGAAYVLMPLAYGPPVASHCYSMPTIPPFPPPGYLLGPAQFYIDVSHALNLATGVGGTLTNQGVTFPNSVAAPGSSGFLSGSFPDCTGVAGGRVPATPDFLSMKIRGPLVCAPAPGSIALFTVSSAQIVQCGSPFELPLGLFFPSACSSGVICIDPATIFLQVVMPLTLQNDAMVTYGPLLPIWRGFGLTHQAFILDPTTAAVHAGPCDRQEL